MANDLTITVRYARELADPDLDQREEHFSHGELDWSVPTEESAIVLVDCWADYPLRSFTERTSRICAEIIGPLLPACRQAGVAVVHAPSPDWAANYPRFDVGGEPARHHPTVRDPEWPPARQGNDAYRVPRCGDEPVYRAWWRNVAPNGLRIHPAVEPVPGDYVVSTGEQLHSLCRSKRIRNLFFAGFATNICIRFRDYGMQAMKERGYNVILVRDATSGIEGADSVRRLCFTRASIHYIELKVGVTVTSDGLLDSCRAVSIDRASRGKDA